MLYSGHSLGAGVLPLCRGVVGVFYNPSQLGNSLNKYNSATYYLEANTVRLVISSVIFWGVRPLCFGFAWFVGWFYALKTMVGFLNNQLIFSFEQFQVINNDYHMTTLILQAKELNSTNY